MTHYFIRHAQSTGNAGGKTSDPNSIPLSPKGTQEAQNLVAKLAPLPIQRIFCSPFIRTQLTAQPYAESKNLPIEIIPIQEFTHLEPSRVQNTTEADRKTLRENFWNKRNPNLRDGPNSESFQDLLYRTATLTSLLRCLQEPSAFFGHGRFFSIFCLQTRNPDLSSKELLDLTYDTFMIEKLNFPNATPYEVSVENSCIHVPDIPKI